MVLVKLRKKSVYKISSLMYADTYKSPQKMTDIQRGDFNTEK